jgi:pimeloyl-ACP methyl ester carboxylesterase
MTALSDQGFLELGDLRLEYRMTGPHPHQAPTLILLHEGLGSAGMWGDFPEKISAATGCGAFAWSRVGYGYSSPAKLPRQLDFMHVEAQQILPRLLDAIGFRQGLLIGHSDGASIAALYAGSVQDHRVRGLVLEAPHFIVEDVTIHSIREIRQAFDTTDVRQRFQRWHGDADATLAYIRVPLLIIQGEHDHYGTERQIEIAKEECYCPIDVLMIPGIQHIPHREAPEVTLKAITEFAARLLDERQGAAAAAR